MSIEIKKQPAELTIILDERTAKNLMLFVGNFSHSEVMENIKSLAYDHPIEYGYIDDERAEEVANLGGHLYKELSDLLTE
jgi:hypothetical protein